MIFGEIRRRVREEAPLIHSITNPISINQCANAILAVGAKPIMAEHPEEVCEITATSSALLLNLGNITDARLESMMASAEVAHKKNIPFVIDLVGVACSRLRRRFALSLTEKYHPHVIKGNYSEISAICNPEYKFSGVDADNALIEGTTEDDARRLSQRYNTTVLASGRTDIITDGKRLIRIKNGTPQLASVTGTGCILGALTASYMSVCRDIYAPALACAVLGISGELSETDKGGGTFMVNLMDKLSALSDTEIKNHLKMEETEIEKA